MAIDLIMALKRLNGQIDDKEQAAEMFRAMHNGNFKKAQEVSGLPESEFVEILETSAEMIEGLNEYINNERQ